MPGFKVFTSAVHTAADVNDFLMEQCVIQCTSATRPAGPHEGMTIYETDLNRMMVYDGALWRQSFQLAWTARTPVLTNFTNAGSNTQAYALNGVTVAVSGHFTVGALTGLGNPVQVDLPFAVATRSGGVYNNHYMGSAMYFDAGSGERYIGVCYAEPSTNRITFVNTNGAGGGGLVGTSQVGNNPGFSLGGVGDGIFYSITYEGA